MDFATVQQVAPIARRLGVDTFVLDDGWQAALGRLAARLAAAPGAALGRHADSKFRRASRTRSSRRARGDRADEARPVDEPDGLQPGVGRPTRQHPEWACAPIGDGLAALQRGRPRRAARTRPGIGAWGAGRAPARRERASARRSRTGASRYFKFDFLVWLDCGPGGARDLYEFHDAFVAMLDRLRADHPDVTFQIDETNDYRLFPFESVDAAARPGSRTAARRSTSCCTTSGT